MNFEGTTAPIVPARGRALGAAASLLASVAVHGAFALGAAGVAWQIASEPTAPPSRAVLIRFEDVAAAEGIETVAAVGEPLPAPVPPLLETQALPQPAGQAPEPSRPTEPETQPVRERIAMELPPSILSAAPALAATRPAPSDVPARAANSQGDHADLSGAGGVRFAGLGASNARSVVYVVDASGPMVTSLPRVIEELRRSIEQLSSAQKFDVVLFRSTESGGGAEVFSPVLMRATPSAKRRLVEWLSQVSPTGASHPLAGLEAALALRPDAVFLLSRAIARSGGGVWQAGMEQTLARLEELNPPVPESGRRATLIQTIQFLEDDPTGIMQAIGARHGEGAGYRVIRRSEDIAGQVR